MCKPTQLQKRDLRPYKDIFQKKLQINLVLIIAVKLFNLYLSKLLIAITPLLILGPEFFETIVIG